MGEEPQPIEQATSTPSKIASEMLKRREFLIASAAVLMTAGRASLQAGQGGQMYGLIGKITSVAGKREELIEILLASSAGMTGCLSYVVAKDTSDADGIWISEVWDNEASHQASLTLPAVKDAIAKGRPLIAGFSNRVVTTPVGGVGLTRAPADQAG